MAFVSRVQASGQSGFSAIQIVGDTASSLVATGSTANDALQLTAAINAITTSAASTGVRLPATEAGARVSIYNLSGQTITIYPQTGSTINNAAASVTVANTKSIELIADTATHWFSQLSA